MVLCSFFDPMPSLILALVVYHAITPVNPKRYQ